MDKIVEHIVANSISPNDGIVQIKDRDAGTSPRLSNDCDKPGLL